MTIWIFGDSYAHMNWHRFPDEKSWPEILGKKLSCDVKILGNAGTGPEYMFHIFNKFVDDIRENDIIIICFSFPIRKWFFYDRPTVTHGLAVQSILSKKNHLIKISNEEALAIEMYEQYLENPTRLDAASELFFRVLNNLSKEKNVKSIIMNTDPYIKSEWRDKFNLCKFIDGYLGLASIDECDDDMKGYDLRKYLYKDRSADLRAGHFSYRNHKVLSNLLENCILEDKSFNLNKDLLTGFITVQSYIDPDFRRQEFMGSDLV